MIMIKQWRSAQCAATSYLSLSIDIDSYIPRRTLTLAHTQKSGYTCAHAPRTNASHQHTEGHNSQKHRNGGHIQGHRGTDRGDTDRDRGAYTPVQTPHRDRYGTPRSAPIHTWALHASQAQAFAQALVHSSWAEKERGSEITAAAGAAAGVTVTVAAMVAEAGEVVKTAG